MVLAAAVALALLTAAGPAAGAPSKKTCKKAKPGSALAKKCKKKRQQAAATPAPAPILQVLGGGGGGVTQLPPADRDSDGVPDSTDNCVRHPNANQADADMDSTGNVCEGVPRIEIEWAEDADVDVHIWIGTEHASTKSPNGISNVSFSADDSNGGIEEVSAPANDKIVVGICNNGDAAHSTDSGPTAVVKATAYFGLFGTTVNDLMVRPNEGSFAITTPSGPELPPGHPFTGDWCAPMRAELTWDNAVDLDLHVYDALGNHASQANPTAIPNAYLTADDSDGFGPEQFFDLQWQSKRQLYLFTCLEAVNGAPAALWSFDLTVYEPPFARNASAVNAPPAAGQEGFVFSSPNVGPPAVPPTGYCPPDPP